MWLRPGKQYLFGRVKNEGVRHVIQHNSISRKHMVIAVSPVQPGDGVGAPGSTVACHTSLMLSSLISIPDRKSPSAMKDRRWELQWTGR